MDLIPIIAFLPNTFVFKRLIFYSFCDRAEDIFTIELDLREKRNM